LNGADRGETSLISAGVGLRLLVGCACGWVIAAAGFGGGVGMASTPMRRAMTLLGGWMGISL